MRLFVNRRGVLFLFLVAAIWTSSDYKTKGAFLFMDFLKILKILTQDKNLTRTDICVMAVLTTYAQYEEDQSAELSYSDIHEAFETIPIRTIQRCVKHLQALQYIQIIRNGTQKNRYKVLIPIPKIQAKPIYQKKNSNKIQSDDEFIERAKKAALSNPFLQ